MPPNTFKCQQHWLTSGLLCLALTACNTAPTAVDLRFGDAVKQAQEQQTLHAEPPPCVHGMGQTPCPMAPNPGMHSPMRQNMREHMREHMSAHHRSQPADTDGVSAHAAVTRYQDSFKSPPPPTSVFNIGLGSASAR